jgi:hypothetical protein
MKKKRIALLALVALAAGTAAILPFMAQEPSPRRIESTFLGFTNTLTGPSARFGITYPPRLRGWSWRGGMETSYRRAEAWEPWKPGEHGRKYFSVVDNKPPLPRTRDGKAINTVMELPVGETNAVWRIVVQVDESPRWPVWPVMMAQKLKAFATRTPLPKPAGPGHNYFLINETSEVK